MTQRYVKVALCQRSGYASKEENRKATVAMVEEAVQNCPNLDVVAFPEYSYYLYDDEADGLKSAESLDGPYVTAMRELAKKHRVNLLPGTFTEPASEHKIRNTSVFINREGEIIGKYSKIHLMDAIGMKESDTTEPGNELSVFDTDFGRVGMMVCFDLRFPELARTMVLKGADTIFCMANFAVGTPLPPRTDHWDLLVRSTALYNLTWMCAVNQYGNNGDEHPFGRSMVADPWGTVVAQASGGMGIVYATLDMEYQDKVRDSVATWRCRRPDIYDL